MSKDKEKQGGAMRLGAAAAVVAAAVVAAIAVGDNPRDVDKRGEFIETTIALKGMGVADIGGAIHGRVGGNRRDVDDVVATAVGRSNRDARSLRGGPVTVIVTNLNATVAWALWGEAWCEPLTGLTQHTACLAANSGIQGVPMCKASASAGRVARAFMTDAQRTRAQTAVGNLATIVDGDGASQLATLGWVPCE